MSALESTADTLLLILVGVEIATLPLILTLWLRPRFSTPPLIIVAFFLSLAATVLGLLLSDPAISFLLAIVAVVAGVSLLTLFGRHVLGWWERAFRREGHDTLTGLPNRQSFYEYLETALAVADREQFGVGLLYLDLDHYKEVNETYGHLVGDKIIVDATRRFQEHLRRGDRIFRMGGDEFVLVVQGVDSANGAAIVAEKLLAGMHEQFRVAGQKLYIGLTIGIAWYPGDARDAGELIRKSDEALSEGKKDRNTYRFYTEEIQSTAAHHVAVVNGLRTGLEAGEFSLAYQPIMGEERNVIGVEALLRWNSSVFESISPEEFIPVAESSGFIQELGQWVLEEAASRRAALAKRGFYGFMAINISAYQLRSGDFIDFVKGVLRRHRIKPGWLHFEITETSLMATDGIGIEVLESIKALGVTLAIDDFGKGYSSLSYLRHLPVEVLKIDRSFILGIIDSVEDRSIIRAISSLAEGLGLTVVAEGVETDDQFLSVRENRCNAFQGYLFSRPVAYDAFVDLLDANN